MTVEDNRMREYYEVMRVHKGGVITMATTERERWTDLRCPRCGAWMRLFGAVKFEMMMCMDRCHDLCYWPDDYNDEGEYIGGLK